MIAFDLYPRKCAVCGKRFEAGCNYAYREGKLHKRCKYFCSWRCLRQYQQNKAKRKAG